LRSMLFLFGVLGLLSCKAADPVSSAELISQFWAAETDQEQQVAIEALVNSGADVDTMYRWLSQGPEYSDLVPTGIVESSRIAADDLEFPYVILVPVSYDPSRAYPVDFMLHGGVSRPPPENGSVWWRSGYETLADPERIVVVPAAWDEARWWFENQAENLQEILRQVKRRYHVDDNRVYLTGTSDGGTGAYFFAFKQPTDWAAFLPYIAQPAVLQNPDSGRRYRLYFENLLAKPLYMVNGENDPLYPAATLNRFVEVLRDAEIPHTFTVIEGGGHNTNWLPEQAQRIEDFKQMTVRDPLPDTVQWVTDPADNFNRNHWLLIDELESANQPGMVKVERQGNLVSITTLQVEKFTLLFSPLEIDFGSPLAVYLNGRLVMSESIRQDVETLLKWAAKDKDRSMLFTAELSLRVSRL